MTLFLVLVIPPSPRIIINCATLQWKFSNKELFFCPLFIFSSKRFSCHQSVDTVANFRIGYTDIWINDGFSRSLKALQAARGVSWAASGPCG